VRNRRVGFKLRRQHVIAPYIVDFYCEEAKLVIEIDGDSHADLEQHAYDQRRSAYLHAQGFRVIRFTNEDINLHLAGVLERIVEACQQYSSKPHT
jgi:very-short-patch-repair endonuclease